MKKLLFLLITFASSQAVWAHGISESDKESMISGSYLDYIGLGATHMITGYDHLLFLFGVIFFLTKFKDVVKFITAFTLGHCVTLIFATFMGISANYFIIDAVIALTVIYKGFDNLDGFKKVFKRESPNLLVLVFIFGLIHGFGLSARLQQLPLGEDGLLLKILSFNLGVELGQIAALSVMLLVLNYWRKHESFKKFSSLSNYALVLAGLGLFVFQMYGFFTETPEKDHSQTEIITSSQNKGDWKDTNTIVIPANKSLEFKFYIKKGNEFEYEWETNKGNVFFDFHGDAPLGAFESFQKKTSNSSSGKLVIPFDGNHGWYWKNKTNEEVTITLKTNGDYQVLGLQ